MRRLDRVGGTATILVTDLAGSTAMFDRLGDEKAERLLRSHLGELRDLVKAFGGTEVKSTGDGIMAAFPAAWLASECAVAMQRSLHLRNDRGTGDPLHVRIGLHSGDTTVDRHDHYGIAVAVAARLCDEAPVDGILVSRVTRDLVGTRGGHAFVGAGIPPLKGIDEPVTAYALDWGPGELPPGPPPGLERRRGALVGAASAVAVLALGGIFVMARSDEPPPEPAPVAGGEIVRVSVRRNGGETTGESTAAEVSGDASHVVFESNGTDLTRKDANGDVLDVFHVEVADGLRPRSLRLVSRNGGEQANAASTEPSVSDDGSVVAFLSEATNLAAGADANGARDVFMHLVPQGETSRVSISTAEEPANGPAFEVDVSGDGNFIGFTTAADNLASHGDNNRKDDIFVRDVVQARTNRANIQTNTLDEANKDSTDPSLSQHGEFVAFASPADTLSTGDTNNNSDVFRYDRARHETVRASVAAGGGVTNAAGPSSRPSISDDGKRIAFISKAENLTPEDTSADLDVFVYDFDTERTTVVTEPVTPGGSPRRETANPTISGDGRYVVFDSTAPNLVPGDDNGVRDIFRYDLEERVMIRLSVDESGRQASEPSFDPTISDDGAFVAFTSLASLVVTDTNEVGDVYLRGSLR